MVELRGQIELDTLPGPWEGDSSDQQHKQDEVGECGREIYHLRHNKWGERAGLTFLLPCSSPRNPHVT